MKYFNDFKNWLWKYRLPFLLAVLFLLLTSPIYFYLIQFRMYFDIFWGVLFTTSIFLIPLYFFRNHLKLYFFLPVIFILFVPVALFPIIKFRNIFNDSIMMLVHNTNKQEAWELLRPYLISIIISFTSIIIILIFIYLLLPKRTTPKKAFLTSVVALILFLSAPAISMGVTHYMKHVKIMLYSHYPFYLGYFGHTFYKELQNVNDYSTAVKDFHFHAYKKDSLKQRQIYILVIGETGRYDHWGINGYYRNTSPLLSRVKSLLSYKNDITAGSFTEVSVPVIITRATPQTFDLVWKQKGIASVFNEAGFETYWITNQFYGDDRGMIAVHAREADHLLLLQKSSNVNGDPVWDMQVVDSFKKYMEQGPSKMFFVLHTMGSHFEYNKRYPPQYNVFKPSGEGRNLSPSNPANKAMLINGYDNSILYTDAVLDSIISIMNQKGIVGSMLYVADHGENLMDDSRQMFLHSPGTITRYVAHVPLFVFTTPDYDSVYAQKVDNLKKHVDSKISSDDVFATLCGMADISFPGWDSSRSISSPYFTEKPRFILAGINNVVKFSDVK